MITYNFKSRVKNITLLDFKPSVNEMSLVCLVKQSLVVEKLEPLLSCCSTQIVIKSPWVASKNPTQGYNYILNFFDLLLRA
jgi:hypothetical protein